MDEYSNGALRWSAWDIAASVVVLFCLAIVQPILYLVGENPEFLVAHDATRGDILALAFGLVVGVPAFLTAIVLVARGVNERAGALTHAGFAWILLSILVLGLLKSIALPGVVLVSAALLVAGVAVRAGRSSRQMQRLTRVLTLVPLGVLVLFLLASPSAALLRGTSEVNVGARARTPSPVLMLMFDELPVASLMDRAGNIDAHLFPNFARLARDAVWYRNTTTVYYSTSKSVSAMLSGRYARKEDLPTHASFPNNLFTLLADDYDVRAHEPVTALCPKDVCGAQRRQPSAGERWSVLLSDLRFVGMHILLPKDLTADLPPVDQDWAHFAGRDEEAPAPTVRHRELRHAFREAITGHRGEDLLTKVGTVKKSKTPSLTFIHSMLPHPPWVYAPDGRIHTREEALFGLLRGPNEWTAEEWRPVISRRAHLLHVQFVDRLLGQTIDHLEREGMYDETVLVVVSDHGAAFTPSLRRRTVAKETVGDIAAVPLFVKPQGRGGGRIDDQPRETVDILPTIAELLGAKLPFPIDGHSLLKSVEPNRLRSVRSDNLSFDVSARGSERVDAVRRKYADLGALGRSLDLFETGGYPRLIGRSSGNAPQAAGSVTIDEPGARRRATATLLPLIVRGRAYEVDAGTALAIAVNGRVQVVTRAFANHGRTEFIAFLPPRSLRRGENVIEVLLVDGSGNLRRLPEA